MTVAIICVVLSDIGSMVIHINQHQTVNASYIACILFMSPEIYKRIMSGVTININVLFPVVEHERCMINLLIPIFLDYNLTDEKVGWWKEEHFNASDMDGNGCLNLTEFNEYVFCFFCLCSFTLLLSLLTFFGLFLQLPSSS